MKSELGRMTVPLFTEVNNIGLRCCAATERMPPEQLVLTSGEKPLVSPSGITRIVVRNLFGHLSYDIPVSHRTSPKEPTVLILYGENGTGKTTILRLLVNVLSPVDNQGHKSRVSHTAFERFTVHFDDGTVVTALRHGVRMIGSFAMTVESRGALIDEIEFEANNDLDIKMSETEKGGRIREFLATLRRLDLGLFFLSDDRTVTTNLYRKDAGSRTPFAEDWSRSHEYIFHYSEAQPAQPADPLHAAVERAVEWVQQKALRGSSRGELDTNNIYTDIVRRISSAKRTASRRSGKGIKAWESRLKALADRSEKFAAFGLTSPITTAEMAKSLRESAKPALPLLEQVIEPYIDGMQARLDALEDVRHTLEVLLNVLNDFYTGKRVAFDLHAGFSVLGFADHPVPLSLLSSGERQLLLLFCNVLAAGERRSIFIIDEPELSLNIKWQRSLISALMACVQSSQTQFIFASHSIELIARHRGSAVRLRDSAMKRSSPSYSRLSDGRQENT